MSPQSPLGSWTLTASDSEILDDLLEAQAGGSLRLADQETGARPGGADTEQARRARVRGLLDLIARWPAQDPPADLVQRTMRRVPERGEAGNLVIGGPDGAGRRRQLRWSDLGVSAAAVLISFCLLWPALQHTRADARRIACANHLAATGAALAHYGSDFGGVMPRHRTQPGEVWWDVGKDEADGSRPVRSNSAHLYLLVRGRYVGPRALACPENPRAPGRLDPSKRDWASTEAVSYSYQNQYSSKPARLEEVPTLAILADKNPLFALRKDRRGLEYLGQRILKTSASRFHGPRGQNVLFASGDARWTPKPLVRSLSTAHDDNIWLANGVDWYEGTETPAGPDDSFLVP